jgi:hypothetical protein
MPLHVCVAAATYVVDLLLVQLLLLDEIRDRVKLRTLLGALARLDRGLLLIVIHLHLHSLRLGILRTHLAEIIAK